MTKSNSFESVVRLVLLISMSAIGCSSESTVYKDGALGTPCESAEDCLGGLCVWTGLGAVCSHVCSEPSDCPFLENWDCRPGITAADLEACRCIAQNDGVEVCSNGVDEDCDGVDTPCLVCDGMEVPLESTEHCGTCDNACPEHASCVEGECTCEVGYLRCGDDCVNRFIDSNNCGGCGRECAPHLRCIGGACKCTEGDADCDGACVDLDTDVEHCGACGLACPQGHECVAGECECGPTWQMCADECVDLRSDHQHCGSCDNVCPAVAECASSVCNCPAGQSVCLGECVSFQTDPSHCGFCGNACPLGAACVDGSACVCPEGQAVCDGVCTDHSTNPFACGGCGIACPEGVSCTGGMCDCPLGSVYCGAGICADLTSEAPHCGACFAPCASGLVCESAECVCPLDGHLYCNGTCLDVTANNSHCGACNSPCSIGAGCIDGQCLCPDGQEDCDGTCRATQSDASNCGECGKVCPVGASCMEGSCTCPVENPDECGGVCVNNDINRFHCGECGNRCATGANCQSGSCVCSGGDTYEGCDGTCVDTDSDLDHCGGCGIQCAIRCKSGACVAVERVFAPDIANRTCWLMTDKTLMCAGDVGTPELRPYLPKADVPTEVPGLTNVVDVSLSWEFQCVALEGGEVACFGANFFSQVRPGSSAVPAPTIVEGVANALDVACTTLSSCVATATGEIFCWGANFHGQVGNGTSSLSVQTPTAVVNIDDAVTVDAGGTHVCAIRADKTVWCWGRGEFGRLGDGDSTYHDVSTPRRVIGLDGVAVTGVSLGDDVTCAWSEDGAAYCWGSNAAGMIGNGGPSDVSVSVATRVSDLDGVVHMDVGSNHVCAVLSTGEVRCWGRNDDGQLGIGSTSPSLYPLAVQGPGLVSATEVAVGRSHTCIRTFDGGSSCWGSDGNGQLGYAPSSAIQTLPIPVSW